MAIGKSAILFLLCVCGGCLSAQAKQPAIPFLSGDANIFIRTNVDKRAIKKGERVILECRLYTKYDTEYLGSATGFEIEGELLSPAGTGPSPYFGIQVTWGSLAQGAIIQGFALNSPAYGILQKNDFVKKINEVEVKGVSDVDALLKKNNRNEPAKFSITRNNVPLEVFVFPMLSNWKGDEILSFGYDISMNYDKNLITVNRVQSQFIEGEPVLKVGDVIETIDGVPIRNMSELNQVSNELVEGKSYSFLISRDGSNRYVSVLPSKKKASITSEGILFQGIMKKEKVGGQMYVGITVAKIKLTFYKTGTFTVYPAIPLVKVRGSSWDESTVYALPQGALQIEVT